MASDQVRWTPETERHVISTRLRHALDMADLSHIPLAISTRLFHLSCPARSIVPVLKTRKKWTPKQHSMRAKHM
jgi:hypothetical protein